MKYQLDPRPLPKSKGLSAWGKGLEGKGRGSDKGPITVAEGVLGRSGCCHGRGRGFESRRPRHFKSGTYSAERGRRPGPTPSACCRETRTPPASRPPSPPRHRQNQSGSPACATTACLKGEAAVTRALANLRRFRRRTAEAPDCPGAVGRTQNCDANCRGSFSITCADNRTAPWISASPSGFVYRALT